MNTVQLVIEFLGTFAFAISGIRWAAFKNFDWFGGYVVGLATAIGGRMKNVTYAAMVTHIYRKYVDMYLERGRKGFDARGSKCSIRPARR